MAFRRPTTTRTGSRSTVRASDSTPWILCIPAELPAAASPRRAGGAASRTNTRPKSRRFAAENPPRIACRPRPESASPRCGNKGNIELPREIDLLRGDGADEPQWRADHAVHCALLQRSRQCRLREREGKTPTFDSTSDFSPLPAARRVKWLCTCVASSSVGVNTNARTCCLKIGMHTYCLLRVIQLLQEGKQVRCRFSGTCGSDAQNVAVLDENGNALHLNGSRFLVFCVQRSMNAYRSSRCCEECSV